MKSAPAIHRAAAVLRLLGRSEAPLGVQAVARDLGLVPSTCLYLLRALVAEGLVAFDPRTKHYALDVGVVTLARQWLRRSGFAELARPALETLSRRFGVTTLGVQVSGADHIVVVALAHADSRFHLSAEIGSRFPLLVSATGRVIAAFGDVAAADLAVRFNELRWDAPPTFDQWLGQVEAARSLGYAVDEGEYIAGLTIVSAPVWQARGPPSHALVAIAVSAALDGRRGRDLARDLVACASEVTARLGGTDG